MKIQQIIGIIQPKRSYVQGPAVIRGVIDALPKNGVRDLSLRLVKPMATRPLMTIEEAPIERKASTGGVGSYLVDGAKRYFTLEDSGEPCFEGSLNEDEFMSRAVDAGDRFIIENLHHDDRLETDPHMIWNAISRKLNFEYFKETTGQVLHVWYTGNFFPDLAFLNDEMRSLAVSKIFKPLTAVCNQRDVYYNGVYVGNRTAVYGAK